MYSYSLPGINGSAIHPRVCSPASTEYEHLQVFDHALCMHEGRGGVPAFMHKQVFTWTLWLRCVRVSAIRIVPIALKPRVCARVCVRSHSIARRCRGGSYLAARVDRYAAAQCGDGHKGSAQGPARARPGLGPGDPVVGACSHPQLSIGCQCPGGCN